MSTLALIGLGSNLGDRKATLDAAMVALAETPGVEVRAISSYRETVPVGGPSGQGAFLNAAASLETTLDPFALHARLRRIEAEAGRVRRVRWGERTLDLDLLVFGDLILDTPDLAIPHPRMAVRRFVLAPLVEIAPDELDPITVQPFTGLLANLDRRPSYAAIIARDFPEVETVARRVANALGVRPLLRSGPPEDLESLRRDLDRLTQALDRAACEDPESWIVSGFDPADESTRLMEPFLNARRAGLAVNRADLDRVLQFGQAIDREGPTPTFNVGIAGDSGRSCTLGAEVPFLRFPPGSDPVVVADEIVAACLASRA